jgi:uncharacterized repeat protein (TIGR01451 family)
MKPTLPLPAALKMIEGLSNMADSLSTSGQLIVTSRRLHHVANQTAGSLRAVSQRCVALAAVCGLVLLALAGPLARSAHAAATETRLTGIISIQIHAHSWNEQDPAQYPTDLVDATSVRSTRWSVSLKKEGTFWRDDGTSRLISSTFEQHETRHDASSTDMCVGYRSWAVPSMLASSIATKWTGTSYDQLPAYYRLRLVQGNEAWDPATYGREAIFAPGGAYLSSFPITDVAYKLGQANPQFECPSDPPNQVSLDQNAYGTITNDLSASTPVVDFNRPAVIARSDTTAYFHHEYVTTTSGILRAQKRADLAVTMSAPTTATVGERTILSTVVRNNGPNPATNVTLTGTMPAGVKPGKSNSTKGTCATSGLTCQIGTLRAGASATISTVLIAKASAAGDTLYSSARASADEFDPDLTNNVASVAAKVNGTAGIPQVVAELRKLRTAANLDPQGAAFATAIQKLIADLNARTTIPSTPETKIVVEALRLWESDPGNLWGTYSIFDPSAADLVPSNPQYAEVKSYSNKCNIYVAETLYNSLGIDLSAIPDDSTPGRFFPTQARTWYDRTATVPHYDVVPNGTLPQLGDVVAMQTENGHHVGIYLGTYDGSVLYASARGTSDGVLGVPGVQAANGIQIKTLQVDEPTYRHYRP